MKLRVRGQSLRLRLTRKEVAAVAAGERVQAALILGALPSQKIEYSVTTSPVEALVLNFSEGNIEVQIPTAQAQDWANSEKINLSVSQQITEGVKLKLLIEKDFQCLKPRREGDDDDTFPHPKAGSLVC